MGEITAPATTFVGSTVKASWAFAPALTMKPALATFWSPDEDATRLHGPALSTLRSAKIATPAVAVTVFVPESAAPTAQVPMPRVTSPVNDGTTAFWASSAVTTTAGAITLPATTALGCVVKTRCVPVTAFTLKGALVAPVSPRGRRRQGVPDAQLVEREIRERREAGRGGHGLRAAQVALPGFVPMATVTLFVAVGTRLPNASCTATTTAGAIAASGTTPDGCTVNASCAGDLGTTSNGVLVAGVRPAARRHERVARRPSCRRPDARERRDAGDRSHGDGAERACRRGCSRSRG